LPYPEGSHVSLWTLLVLISGGTAVGGAIPAASPGGSGRTSIAVLTGLVVGVAGIWAWFRIHRRIPQSPGPAVLFAFYGGTFLWPILSGVLGFVSARAVLGWLE
jgi:hypothetical protein